MTVPTNIPETPMGHTEQESLLKYKGKKHLISPGSHPTCLQDFGDEQVESLSHWIHY